MRRQAKANKAGDDGMLPMINIIFLLLVFFMIAGQIVPREDNLELPASSSEADVGVGRIEVSIAADGVPHVDGEVVGGDLATYLASRLPGSSGNAAVLTCRVHRDLPASALDPVLRAARQLQITTLQIVTEWQP